MKKNLHLNSIRKTIRDTESILSASDLIKIVGNSPARKLQIIPLDRKYFTVDVSTWRLMLERTRVDSKTYLSERYDCDDFSIALKGRIGQLFSMNTCGFICDFSGKHAYNCIVAADHNLYIVEPQTDNMWLTPPTSPQYKLESGFIIF